jgi:hypothetical protein
VEDSCGSITVADKILFPPKRTATAAMAAAVGSAQNVLHAFRASYGRSMSQHKLRSQV